jgi:hypothetical protein
MQTKLQFSCESCTDQNKVVRGCFTKAKAPILANGIKGSVNRCPVIDFFEVNQYLKIYKYWQEGHYPNSGSWAEQPNKLVETMEYIHGVISESS